MISEPAKSDLVFLGMVQKIEMSPIPQSSHNWIIHCCADQIISGDFKGSTFSFRVHSPIKSGLEVGKHYKVRAEKKDNDYAVDQWQWSFDKPVAGDIK